MVKSKRKIGNGRRRSIVEDFSDFILSSPFTQKGELAWDPLADPYSPRGEEQKLNFAGIPNTTEQIKRPLPIESTKSLTESLGENEGFDLKKHYLTDKEVLLPTFVRRTRTFSESDIDNLLNFEAPKGTQEKSYETIPVSLGQKE